MAVKELFAGVPVADYEAAAAWYERLLGRPPDFYPNDNEAVWQLDGAGWIYVVGDAQRAGRALLTLMVDDLEALVAELAERGLAAGPIETVTGVVRKAPIADPDGNLLTFAEAPEA